MYNLEARGGFGDAAPESTGTAAASFTSSYSIPAAVLPEVSAAQSKVLRWARR
jgi:hypothetical protein